MNKLEVLKLFGDIKHASGKETWKELFGGDKEKLSVFIEIAAEAIIKDNAIEPFLNIENWQQQDLSELIAYFDSSTKDEDLKKRCLKYICQTDEDWTKYGVTVRHTVKEAEEQEKDLQKIRRMLGRVGYLPYQRGTYAKLREEVLDDVYSNPSPLLLSKLLYAVYRWQGTYGNQIDAEKCAVEVRDLIMQMRKEQTPVYNYVMPKLALEIIESPGHYHELIVNPETMNPGFWEWFLIGYLRSRADEDKMLTYTRVYTAGKDTIPRGNAKSRMQTVFQDIAN